MKRKLIVDLAIWLWLLLIYIVGKAGVIDGEVWLAGLGFVAFTGWLCYKYFIKQGEI